MPRVKVKGVANPMDFPDDMDIQDIKAFLQKRFGFVDNKGKNKDFTISESMNRPPSTSK
jgi:hypothetical protein